MDDNKGVSLIILNSNKANSIFKEISEKLKYQSIDTRLALLYNHSYNVPITKRIKRKIKNLINRG